MSKEFYPGQGPEEQPELGPLQEISMEDQSSQPTDLIENGPTLPELAEAPVDVLHEAVQHMHYELQNRLITSPEPTREELEIGVYVEEIQPQVRDAILTMRDKGYDTGNVLHSGFNLNDPGEQTVNLVTPLSVDEIAILENNGYTVENNRLSFRPVDETDLGSIKAAWDFLAELMPEKEEPAGPAMFTNAVTFREAAVEGTLLSFYMPDGLLDMAGTKYIRERDPWADSEMFFSPDAVSAARELTFIDRYHDLQKRITENPEPTSEELNMGAFTEELEPQVRDAVILMRRKGYNTGSSGFFGQDHVDQTMDIKTPIDENTREWLAEYGVGVSENRISFTPESPSNLESITKTWNMIAGILPDLGRHAEPADNAGASLLRYAAKHGRFNDYLEVWTWQSGALNGYMQPLTMTLIHEGRDFGPDVFADARTAEAMYKNMAMQEAREHLEEVNRRNN